MNPENEVKKANLEQDNKVTEQLPEQDFNQNTAELDSPAPDEAPVTAEQHSESETKTTQTIPADSAQPASSEPIVPPEGALPQMSVPAAPASQDSFQPAAYARETDVKPGKFASFCKKTWVKVVPIVGAVIIFFMAGLGAGMAISHHGSEGHTPPGHGAQMAPGGRMGAGKVPGGKWDREQTSQIRCSRICTSNRDRWRQEVETRTFPRDKTSSNCREIRSRISSRINRGQTTPKTAMVAPLIPKIRALRPPITAKATGKTRSEGIIKSWIL